MKVLRIRQNQFHCDRLVALILVHIFTFSNKRRMRELSHSDRFSKQEKVKKKSQQSKGDVALSRGDM
jgi:hypothetical protein